jgi:hypothetical protein
MPSSAGGVAGGVSDEGGSRLIASPVAAGEAPPDGGAGKAPPGAPGVTRELAKPAAEGLGPSPDGAVLATIEAESKSPPMVEHPATARPRPSATNAASPRALPDAIRRFPMKARSSSRTVCKALTALPPFHAKAIR